MEWDDLWAFYNNVSESIQQHILSQIDIKNLMRMLSPKNQIEVMSFAPKPVIEIAWNDLEPETKRALGYTKNLNRKITKAKTTATRKVKGLLS